MKTVRQIVLAKGNEIWAVHPDDTVYNALNLMAEKNIGAVLVMIDKRLLGIFSERDYARKMILRGRHSKDTPVREVMTPDPVCVDSARTMEECMELMTERHIRHLPIVDRGEHTGVISIGDVVKAIIQEQQGTIDHLENYITGRR
jgi:CBS domain-containing protein